MKKIFSKKTLSAFLAIIMTATAMVGLLTFSAGAETTSPDWDADEITLYNADNVADFFNKLETIDFAGKKIYLNADVDMTSKTIKDRNGATWKGFSGEFDGKGHTISNITVATTIQSAGLFGSNQTSNDIVIKNVSFVGVNYNGNWQPGFFYGMLTQNITVENVLIDFDSFTIKQSTIGGGMIGEFCTANTTANIKNCVVTGTFTDETHNVGGFIGNTKNVSTVTVICENCAMYATLPCDMSAGFAVYAGSFKLKNCISLGTIKNNRTFSANGVPASEGTIISNIFGGGNNSNIEHKQVYTKEAMTGIAAQAILDTHGMTGFAATTTGYPMPKTLIKAQTPTADENALTDYVGYQTTKVADGKFGLRLVANLDANTNLADYDNVGFKVVAFFADGTKVMANNCVQTKVYESITTTTADGTASFAEQGKYIFVQECLNITAANGDITFEITTFATDSEGNETLGATYRFVVDVSEIPSAS